MILTEIFVLTFSIVEGCMGPTQGPNKKHHLTQRSTSEDKIVARESSVNYY